MLKLTVRLACRRRWQRSSGHWKGRTRSWVRPMRYCARRRRILQWQSSIADPKHDRLPLRSSRCLRGRADRQGVADCSIHLSGPCRQAGGSVSGPKRVGRDHELMPEIERVFVVNFAANGARKVWRQLCREASIRPGAVLKGS